MCSVMFNGDVYAPPACNGAVLDLAIHKTSNVALASATANAVPVRTKRIELTPPINSDLQTCGPTVFATTPQGSGSPLPQDVYR
jgi:hypothetical protein